MKILKQSTTKNGNKIELIGNDNHKNILIIGVFHGMYRLEPSSVMFFRYIVSDNGQTAVPQGDVI